MAGGLPLTQTPGLAWVTLAGAWALASLLVWFAPANVLDWQPDLAAAEPWRAFTAAWVHWSPLHLAANLAGASVVAALGWVARLPARAALAWALAWPLTQCGLWLRPELAHYGGLSGVLHAGVAVAAVWLLVQPGATASALAHTASTRRDRWVGVAIVLGLGCKLLLESPWGPVLRTSTEFDIAVAPLAHATGALAGLVCALACAVALQRDAGAATMPR